MHPPGKERRATGHRSSTMTGRWISPVHGDVPVKEGDVVVAVVPVKLLHTRGG
jgi:hypothetical protein